VLFVASDEASFSTGSEFVAHGGHFLGPVPQVTKKARRWRSSKVMEGLLRIHLYAPHPAGPWSLRKPSLKDTRLKAEHEQKGVAFHDGDHEQFSSLSLTESTSTLTTGESSKNSHS